MQFNKLFVFLFVYLFSGLVMAEKSTLRCIVTESLQSEPLKPNVIVTYNIDSGSTDVRQGWSFKSSGYAVRISSEENATIEFEGSVKEYAANLGNQQEILLKDVSLGIKVTVRGVTLRDEDVNGAVEMPSDLHYPFKLADTLVEFYLGDVRYKFICSLY